MSLGPKWEGRRTFGVEIGQDYLVYALHFSRGIPWVHVEIGPQQVVEVPLDFFEITDPTLPDAWEARVPEPGVLLLWPAAFFLPGFQERLLDGDAVASAALERLRHQLDGG